MTTRPPVSPGDLFLFYGLLKQGAAGMPAHIDLEAAGAFLGPGRFRGRLCDLGGFPGATAGEGLCHGVRYRLDEVSILQALDDFENVTDDPETSLYVRQRVHVLNEAGGETGETAWLYRYNQSVDGRREIVDGNWPLAAGRLRETG
ncbi:MAG: gamma-glutamylcyclotransferase family protein [Pseudomonadota bacterium]